MLKTPQQNEHTLNQTAYFRNVSHFLNCTNLKFSIFFITKKKLFVSNFFECVMSCYNYIEKDFGNLNPLRWAQFNWLRACQICFVALLGNKFYRVCRNWNRVELEMTHKYSINITLLIFFWQWHYVLIVTISVIWVK